LSFIDKGANFTDKPQGHFRTEIVLRVISTNWTFNSIFFRWNALLLNILQGFGLLCCIFLRTSFN